MFDAVSPCNVSPCAEGEPEDSAALTPEQREQLRVHKINEKKLRIASLGCAIVSDPYSSVRVDCWSGIRFAACITASQLLKVCVKCVCGLR